MLTNRLPKIAWYLWLIGTAIVVASWLDLVEPRVGWVGWCVALVGTILSVGGSRAPAEPPPAPAAGPEPLCKTCLLNSPRDCRRDDRPNALRCPEYMRY
jgi:hypothetical protein